MSVLDDAHIAFNGAKEEYYADRQDLSTAHIFPMSSGERGTLIGALNKELGGDLNRKQFLKALTGHSSSKDLLDAEWYALKVVTGYGNVGGVWGFGPEAVLHMRACIEEAMQSSDQLGLF